jgi:predicted O-linked N-acetylglucosamine transferase (SPINDLY family)
MNVELEYILNYKSSNEERELIIKNHEEIYKEVYSLLAVNGNIENKILASKGLVKIVNAIDITEYLLLDSKPKIMRELYLEACFNLGTLLKNIAEDLTRNKIIEWRKNNINRDDNNIRISELERGLYDKALYYLIMILQIDFENSNAINQIVSVYTYLCFLEQDNYERCLKYLNNALFFAYDNSTIHYNLGFIYQRLNRIELAIIHYNLGIKLNKNEDGEKAKVNCYNGIASIYRSIKKWPQSLHYLLKASEILPLDPDINNQLGVVYTEMRRTDLAEKVYKKAIENYNKTFISTDSKFLLSEIYLNYGHMFAYNGENLRSIECYNESLKINPKFTLAFQNKIMNLNYLFDELDDKIYISKMHRRVGRLYERNKEYKFNKEYFKSKKINIGIISGDFSEHPVSFFISPLLKYHDGNRFNITCYSECIIDLKKFSENLQFKLIKNKSNIDAADMIYNDNIHILIDLAGHTAFNRLDIFALKPAPIQITYIGYPNTTGLKEMDYRITDNICDGDFSISQKYYTEKLIKLENCFLCYDYKLKELPEIKKNKQDKFLRIGCFNRLNKITDNVIKLFNKILLNNLNVMFVFKTKALLNEDIKNIFLNKFDKNVQERISILNCTLLHEEHVKTYNEIDLAIDTFPYSGTTTTCEALSMGVPVFSIWDKEYYFHAQNVSISILKNSNLDFYICNNEKELMEKINKFKLPANLKEITRNNFFNGNVCNINKYINNIQELFMKLFNDAF